MEKCYKYLFFAAFCMIAFSNIGYAETVYVTDITKITMRSSPGSEHKIIKMLTSGTPLNVVGKSGSWSKVKTKDGKEGWALTRFLVVAKPAVVLLNEFEKRNSKLVKKVEMLTTENTDLTAANQKLVKIEEQYIELKKGADNYLELKKKFEEISIISKEQQEKIAVFENSYKDKIMKWFLIGAGVFVFGILLGMGTKKRRRSYLR